MTANPLRELDEPSAALRILLETSRHGQGINVSKLYEVMNTLGVGRTAIDSSRRELIDARLVAENRMKGGKRGTMTVLMPTPLGIKVADRIQEIQSIIDQAHLRSLP